MPKAKGGKIIQSVQRAVDILNCFDEVDAELSLNQISQRLQLNKSTVHGILNTLYCNGFISQNSDGKYLLGQALFNKARLSDGTNRSVFTDIARPFMEMLSSRYKASSNLFIMENGTPVLLHRVLPTNAAFYVVHHISNQEPLYCTASGKIALAHRSEEALADFFAQTPLQPLSSFTITTEATLRGNLREIRNLGYSYEKEELAEGVSAVSVPICSKDGALAGTLSVSGVAFHIGRIYHSLAEDLKQASFHIQRKMF